MNKIFLKKNYEIKSNNKWVKNQKKETQEMQLSFEEYYKICSDKTIDFFKNVIGSQERVFRNGLGIVTRLISTSPLRDERCIYSFYFKNNKQENLLKHYVENRTMGGWSYDT